MVKHVAPSTRFEIFDECVSLATSPSSHYWRCVILNSDVYPVLHRNRFTASVPCQCGHNVSHVCIALNITVTPPFWVYPVYFKMSNKKYHRCSTIPCLFYFGQSPLKRCHRIDSIHKCTAHIWCILRCNRSVFASIRWITASPALSSILSHNDISILGQTALSHVFKLPQVHITPSHVWF